MKPVQIISIQTPPEQQSKAQKEFNRRTKKIAALRKAIEELADGIEKMRQKAAKILSPLQNEYNIQRERMVRVLDRSAQSSGFKAHEKKKIHFIICKISRELALEQVEGMAEMFNKYNDVPLEEAEEAENDNMIEVMKEMFSTMYGIEFDDAADLSTPEKFHAYIEQKLNEQRAQEAEKRQKWEEKKAKKPKTAKQQEAEAKRAEKEKKAAEEEKKISKSVREVYLDLVKAFHPDKELDENEKLRKTEIMQRVTAAYETNDLLSLIALQLEFERINASALDALADERIQLFNKTLARQQEDLEDLQANYYIELSRMYRRNNPFDMVGLDQAERALKRDVRTMKDTIKQIKAEVELFQDPALLRRWLKDFEMEEY